MRTSVITTVRHNVGDDFVREGILHLLERIGDFGTISLIHKHAPVTAVYGLEGVRSRALSMVVDPLARLAGLRNRIDEADLVIQSGAPVYWCHPGRPHCGNSEWFGPLIRRRFLRDRRGRKFLSIAGGSGQRYHSDGSELLRCHKCAPFMRDFFDACDLTTLRDSLAKDMLNIAGRDADVLPCTSIFARDRFRLAPERGEYIVLNFMENGGHYTFGQKIDGALWREQFRGIAHIASRMGRVVVACHTKREHELSQTLLPDIETFLIPNEHLAYMKFYARAKFGIVNRVHAGFMMASLGKPVAVIGTDSRALMVRNLNLPSYYVGDVAEVGIEAIVDSASSRTDGYLDEIEFIRAEASARYVAAISSALAS
jgi:hypothetical protein